MNRDLSSVSTLCLCFHNDVSAFSACHIWCQYISLIHFVLYIYIYIYISSGEYLVIVCVLRRLLKLLLNITMQRDSDVKQQQKQEPSPSLKKRNGNVILVNQAEARIMLKKRKGYFETKVYIRGLMHNYLFSIKVTPKTLITILGNTFVFSFPFWSSVFWIVVLWLREK